MHEHLFFVKSKLREGARVETLLCHIRAHLPLRYDPRLIAPEERAWSAANLNTEAERFEFYVDPALQPELVAQVDRPEQRPSSQNELERRLFAALDADGPAL